MYLDTLELANVRGFSSGEEKFQLNFRRRDSTYAGWTVLAGRNGSGKTTLLRAIALALAGPSVARSLVPSFAGWIAEGKDQALISAAFTIGPTDTLSPGGAPPKRRPWAALSWTRQASGPEPSLSEAIPENAPKVTPRRGPWSENPTGWFVAGYGPFRRLSGAAESAQRLMLGAKRTAALVTLFDETASLAESTWWLQEIYPRVLEGNASAISTQNNVLALLDDGLLPEGARVLRYDSDGLWISQNDVELVLEEMSDGYRVVTALVLDIVRRIAASFGHFDIRQEGETVVCDAEGVVLIDEIDVHLHVSWQQRVGFWLQQHFPNVQFIVSTHSPFVCQAASQDGLIRLPAPDEQSRRPRVLGDAEYNAVVNGSVETAVLSSLFGLESTYSGRTRSLRAEVQQQDLATMTPEQVQAARDLLGGSPSEEVAAALRGLERALNN